MEETKNPIVIYQTEDGITKISVPIDEDTVWLTQAQMAELFQRDISVISRHIKNIFEEKELEEKSNLQNLQIANSDKPITLYSLDVIISVGYRVKSQRGIQFRIWANKILKEYMLKGFSLDDDRLKEGNSRYFKELLQRVRDIRTSERNLYQQVTDIYSTAVDYDANSQITRDFFATVQNKMHYAAHKHTAAEVIYERVDSNKPNVGMTNFKGNYITKDDVRVAKNYLTEYELQVLNLIVSQFLDYAELQALERKPMTMQNWIDRLDAQLEFSDREVLTHKGKISKDQAKSKAEKEFEIYRKNEMKQLTSDFDIAIKKITKK